VSAGVGGASAGLIQGALLSGNRYSWGSVWALASAASVLVGVGVGLAVGNASGRLSPGMAGIPAIVVLPMAGQWLVLRKRVDRAGWWPFAVLAGVVTAGVAVSAVRLGAGVPLGASGDPVLGAIGGALLGGVQGAVNGAVLLRLLGQPTARDLTGPVTRSFGRAGKGRGAGPPRPR
jgi:hypothetical protein